MGIFSAPLPSSKKTQVIYMKCFELHIGNGYLDVFCFCFLKIIVVIGELSRIVVCDVDL